MDSYAWRAGDVWLEVRLHKILWGPEYANSSVDWLTVFVCRGRRLFGGYEITKTEPVALTSHKNKTRPGYLKKGIARSLLSWYNIVEQNLTGKQV